jgi:hypothetical protein
MAMLMERDGCSGANVRGGSEYIIGAMRVGALASWLIACVALAGCDTARNLVKQFEYEEEIYLDLDGSATIIVNASIPALAALHGLPLRTDPSARVDRAAIRRIFERGSASVTRVSRPWRRRGRRFVQVRLEIDDIRRLSDTPPLSWSEYRLDRRNGLYVYRQAVGRGAAAGAAAAAWDGTELVGFRMHLPSRIVYHNATTRTVERGNILSWEQPLHERLAGVPLEMTVQMETESILVRTLTVFLAAAAAAMGLLAAAIYWVWRRGRAGAPRAAPGPGAAA